MYLYILYTRKYVCTHMFVWIYVSGYHLQYTSFSLYAHLNIFGSALLPLWCAINSDLHSYSCALTYTHIQKIIFEIKIKHFLVNFVAISQILIRIFSQFCLIFSLLLFSFSHFFCTFCSHISTIHCTYIHPTCVCFD